jgi:DNA-binding CsgD family transcriptional regulator
MGQKSNNSEILIMASVLEAKSKDELVSRLQRVIQSAGFETFMIGLERRAVNGTLIHHVTSDYDLDWQLKYQSNNYAFNDPTVPYCQQSTAPLLWSEEFFRNAGAIHILEEARSYGISHGLSISTHDWNGCKSMMSLVRDKPLDRTAREKAHLIASARLISACVHHTGFHLLEAEEDLRLKDSLTRREQEVLQWIAHGKTTWEISVIMSVSEATVAFHVKNLMRKLDVHNRQQALAVALRIGLIN